MPYEKLAAFKSDVSVLTAAYGSLTDQNIGDAFTVYQYARRTQLRFLLVGRWVQESTEQQPGIDKLIAENFLKMNEIDKGGSVLNSTNWSLLMNDAWVLGGIHSTIPFYLASPRTEQTLQGTNPKHPMTVTARELIGIITFGYEVIQGHPSLGEVAQCANKTAAGGATFKAYIDAVNASVEGGALKPASLRQLTAPPRILSKL